MLTLYFREGSRVHQKGREITEKWGSRMRRVGNEELEGVSISKQVQGLNNCRTLRHRDLSWKLDPNYISKFPDGTWLVFRTLPFLSNHRFHSNAVVSIFQRGCNLKGICRVIHDFLTWKGGSTCFHKLLESLHIRKRWIAFSGCKSQHV